MNAIKNITIGHTERLYKPVGYTMLANLVNIIPLSLHRGGAHHLRRVRRQRTTARHGKAVVHLRHIGRLYAGDGSGRTGLLPGQFQRSLRNERIGAYRTGGTSAETLSRISFPARPRRSFVHARYRFHDGRDGHFPPLPQLMGAVVMPVLAFLSLVWIDWRMAVAMFAALPVAILVLWMSTSVQKS